MTTSQTEQKPSRLSGSFLARTSLVAALGLYVTALIINGDTYVSRMLLAVSTAALIGGLTDWYAVETLFRNLWGFHTNILIKRRGEVTESLVDLVEKQVLPVDKLDGVLKSLSVSQLIDGVAADEKQQDTLRALMEQTILELVRTVNPRSMSRVLAGLVSGALEGRDLAPLAAKLAEATKGSRDFDKAVSFVVDELLLIFESQAFEQVLSKVLKSTLRAYAAEGAGKQFIARFASSRIKTSDLKAYLLTVVANFRDPLDPNRVKLMELLNSKISELEEGGELSQQVQDFAEDFLGGTSLEVAIENALRPLRDSLLNPGSKDIEDLVGWVMTQGKAYWMDLGLQGRDTLDARARMYLTSVLQKNHSVLGTEMRKVLAKKDNAELVSYLRKSAGEDLNFIRITGAGVGAIVGLAFFLSPPIALALTGLGFGFGWARRYWASKSKAGDRDLATWNRTRAYADLALAGVWSAMAVMTFVYGAPHHPIAILAEAGLVAGCADLFAVTALFSKIRFIPHTGVIPSAHASLGSQLANTLEKDFFPREKLVERIENTDLVEYFLQYLGDPDQRSAKIRTLALWLQSSIKDMDSSALSERLVVVAMEALRAKEIGSSLGRLIQKGIRNGWDERLLRMLVPMLKERVASPQFVDQIEKLLEQHVAGQIHEGTSLINSFMSLIHDATVHMGITDYAVAAEKCQSALSEELDGLLRPRHPFRRVVRETLSEMAVELRQNQNLVQGLEMWKLEVLSRIDLEVWMRNQLQSANAFIGDSNALGQWCEESGSAYIEHLERDNSHQRRINKAIRTTLKGSLDGLYLLFPRIISEAFTENLPASKLVHFIKSRLGSDLQWVRINGTGAGALIGCALAGITWLILK